MAVNNNNTTQSNSTTYSNGITKWTAEKVAQEVQGTLNTNTIQVGIGCNIKTDLINQTFKIVSNTDPALSLAHFQNSQVTDWTINTNQIVLKSCDQAPIVLVFQSVEETYVGDKRLWKIMEGGNIIACGDEDL